MKIAWTSSFMKPRISFWKILGQKIPVKSLSELNREESLTLELRTE